MSLILLALGFLAAGLYLITRNSAVTGRWSGRQIILSCLILILAALFGLFLLNPVAWIDFLRVDSCLDRGGRWNYEERRCEMTE